MLKRQLALVRHAHALTAPGLRDMDRPLSPEGVKQAVVTADWIAPLIRTDKGRCSLIFSPALRTRQTAQAIAAHLRDNDRSSVHEALYDMGDVDLLRHIFLTPEDISFLIIVGHNPAIGDIAFRLSQTNRECKAAKRLESSGFTPASALLASFEGIWEHNVTTDLKITEYFQPTIE